MSANTDSIPAASSARRPPGRRALRGAVVDLYRRAILDAAEGVFEARGFAEAKMAEIARAAGVAAGTLYNYFDSKEAIVRSLMQYRGEQMLARLDEARRDAQGLGPTLTALAEGALAFVDEHSGIFSVFAQLGGAQANVRRLCGPDAQRLRNRYGEVFHREFQRAARAGELRAGVATDLAAAMMTGALHALAHARWGETSRSKPRMRPHEAAAAMVNLVLEGVAAPRRRP